MSKSANTNPVAQNTTDRTQYLYVRHEGKFLRIALDADPFKGQDTVTVQVDFANTVRTLPGSPDVYDSVSDALMGIARPYAKARQKAADEAAYKAVADAGYTFDAYASLVTRERYLPTVRKAPKSDVLYTVGVKAVPADFDLSHKDSVKGGDVYPQLESLCTDMIAIAQKAPGCKSGSVFEKALKSLYGGMPTHTVNGRRMALLRSCFSTKHQLVNPNGGARVSTWGVDDASARRATFFAALLDTDANIEKTIIAKEKAAK